MMWYALVHDEQLGPMPDTELAELHAQGVVSDDTLVWTATMSDWRPVSEVAEIQTLIADPDFLDEEEGEGATMMMSPGDGDWAAILGGQPPAPDPDRPEVLVQRAPMAEAATEMLSAELMPDDLRLDNMPAAAGLLGPVSAPPLPAPLSDFGEEPGEGSIIDRFPDAPPAPAVEDANAADAFMAPAAVSIPPAQGGRSKLPLILLVLLLIGGGVVAWIFMGPDAQGTPDLGVAAATDAPGTEAPPTVAAVVASAPDAGVEDAGSDAMVIALADLEPESPQTDAPTSDAPTSDAPSTDAPSTDAPASAAPKSAAPKSQAPKTTPPKVKPRTPRTAPKASPKTDRKRTPRVPVKAPTTRAATDKGLPVQLSRDHITGVLRKSGARLRTCAALDEKVKEGTFSVNVVIKRSGVVHSAKVVTGRLRKSPAAKCIEGQVKRFRFGRFSGDPMRIQLPFRL